MDATQGKQGAGPKVIMGHNSSGKSDGGIYFAKGPEFHLKFMAGFIMPFRRELMQMALASTIQREGAPSTAQGVMDLVNMSYAIADAAVLQERATLDAEMARYWDLYLEQGKSTDEVMKAVQESHQDYSL